MPNKPSNLVKRKGIWHTDITVELFNPPRKVRLRESTGETSVSAARSVMQLKVKKLQQQDREGEFTRMRLHAGMKLYLDDYSSAHVKHFRDHDLQYRRLTGSIAGHGGIADKSIDMLTGGDFHELVAKRKRNGMSNSSINQELSFVSAALSWLAENHNIRVPLINWSGLRLKPFKKKRWATVEQLKFILENIHSQIERDLCLLLFSCGARLSEIKNLRWSQVSLNEAALYLHREKVDNEGQLSLTPDCVAMLTRRYNNRDETSPFVFQSERRPNQPIGRPRHIDYAIEKSGLNDDPVLVEKKGKFTIHSLRDSYASILAQSGNHDLNEIRELLGHTTTAMTQKYSHLIPSEVTRKATATFDAAFTSQ